MKRCTWSRTRHATSSRWLWPPAGPAGSEHASSTATPLSPQWRPPHLPRHLVRVPGAPFAGRLLGHLQPQQAAAVHQRHQPAPNGPQQRFAVNQPGLQPLVRCHVQHAQAAGNDRYSRPGDDAGRAGRRGRWRGRAANSRPFSAFSVVDDSGWLLRCLCGCCWFGQRSTCCGRCVCCWWRPPWQHILQGVTRKHSRLTHVS